MGTVSETEASQAIFTENFQPTDVQVDMACLLFNKNFGFLPWDRQNELRQDALKWLKVWNQLNNISR